MIENFSTQYTNQVITQREVIVSGNVTNQTNISRKEVFNTNSEVSGKKFHSRALQDFCNKTQTFNEFDFDDVEESRCSEHKEFKENYLMQVIAGFQLYDAVCSECLSDLQRKNDDSVRSRLYSAIIKDNKDKIVQIKENKIDFNSVTKANDVYLSLQQHVMELADELITFTESFESEVLNKITVNRTDSEDINKIRIFVNEILNERNEPVLRDIGHDELRKVKYIKLAYFLLHFKGIATNINSYNGITAALKLHLTRIIELRNIIVRRLTEWIRYIIGDFYQYLFTLEGLPLDSNFLSGLVIDFIGEFDISKIRLEYEQIIIIRDERIRVLENENNQLRIQIQNYGQQCHGHENNQTIIIQLNEEIEKLRKINNEYLIIIENLRQEIINIKSEIENKFQVIIIKMKEEYETRIVEITVILEDLRKRYIDMEISYKEQITLVIREKEQIIRTHTERINTLIREKEEITKIISEKKTEVQTIDRVVYVDKPVPGPERIVEKVVDRVVYVDKPVPGPERIVEKVVDRVVYVDKPVPGPERIVEKVVDRVVYVDKPVEKIVYIEKPVEVVENFEVTREVDRLLTNVVEIDNSESISTTYKTKYEKYFNQVKTTINNFQEEWNILYTNYITLLSDFKILLDLNDKYRRIILDIEAAIERHNLEIGNVDFNIKQEIESLTRISLSKKNIDWISQKEIVFKSASEIDALKSKISRIEMNKFTNSSILDNVTVDVQNIFTETHTSIIQQNGSIINSFSPSLPDLNSGLRVDLISNSPNPQVFGTQGIIGATNSNVDIRGTNITSSNNIQISTTTNNVALGGNSSTSQYGYVSGGEVRGYQSGSEARNNVNVSFSQSGIETRNINTIGNQSGVDVRNTVNLSGYQSGNEVRNNLKPTVGQNSNEIKKTVTISGYQSGVEGRTNVTGYQSGTELRNTVNVTGYQSGTELRNTVNVTGSQSGTDVRNTINNTGYQSGTEVRNTINNTGYQSRTEVRNTINNTGYQSGTESRNVNLTGYQSGTEVRNSVNVTGYQSGAESRNANLTGYQSGTELRNTVNVIGYQSGAESRNVNLTGYQSGTEVRNSVNVTGYQSGAESRNVNSTGYQSGTEVRNTVTGYQSASDVRNTLSGNYNLGSTNVQISGQPLNSNSNFKQY